MMKRTGRYQYRETGDFQLLNLPYKEDLSMYVILPKKGFGLQKVIKDFTGSQFLKMIKTRAKKVVVL